MASFNNHNRWAFKELWMEMFWKKIGFSTQSVSTLQHFNVWVTTLHRIMFWSWLEAFIFCLRFDHEFRTNLFMGEREKERKWSRQIDIDYHHIYTFQWQCYQNYFIGLYILWVARHIIHSWFIWVVQWENFKTFQKFNNWW